MLYFVIGLPGAFTNWCGAVVAGLARQAVGASHGVEANTLGDIARTILRGDTPHMVVSARAPGGRLRSALLAADRPFVIARDDAWLACADLVLAGHCTLPAAVRQVASSCSAMMGFPSAPAALALDAARDWPDGAATAAAIADHFHFAVSGGDIAAVLDEVGSVDLASRGDDAQWWWDRLAASEQDLLRGALDPYLRDFASQHAASINWSAELFSVGERPSEPANIPIDITGRARCLLQGPHILLPPAAGH